MAMELGQRVTVYHYRRDWQPREVTCDLGCKHRVTYHERKFITITAKRYELVPALGYDHDAYGDVFDAVDGQGRLYTYAPHWDGPGLWKRNDGKAFSRRPVVRMDASFTLNGERIQ